MPDQLSLLTPPPSDGGDAITLAPGSPLQVRIPLEARYAGALLARVIPA